MGSRRGVSAVLVCHIFWTEFSSLTRTAIDFGQLRGKPSCLVGARRRLQTVRSVMVVVAVMSLPNRQLAVPL
jgi:hypothetical protein